MSDKTTKQQAVAAVPVRPQSIMELERFANMAAKSEFVPKDYRARPDNIMVAIQMGSELGLAPMQSLQNISVINGRPAVWGDAMLALCKASPYFEDIRESLEGEGDDRAAICLVRRRGQSPVATRFSVDQAKRANLWGKNVWAQYPERMLQMRARGFALRDCFPDVLRGLVSGEEAQDMPRATVEGTAEEIQPQPPPAAKPAPAASAAREQINADVPMAPTGNGNKIAAALDKWEADCSSVTTQANADALMVSPFARAAEERLERQSPPAWARFNRAKEQMIARLWPIEGDDPLHEEADAESEMALP